MRKKGSRSCINELRDREIIGLYRHYKRVLPFPLSNREICRHIAASSVDRYYISEEAAMLYLSGRCNGRDTSHANRVRLFEAFGRRYDELRALLPGCGRRELVRMVLSESAPCFGLSEERIRYILFQNRIK